MEIIFKTADKGSAIVIMNKSAYISERLRRLSDTHLYSMINEDQWSNLVINHGKYTRVWHAWQGDK